MKLPNVNKKDKDESYTYVFLHTCVFVNLCADAFEYVRVLLRAGCVYICKYIFTYSAIFCDIYLHIFYYLFVYY